MISLTLNLRVTRLTYMSLGNRKVNFLNTYTHQQSLISHLRRPTCCRNWRPASSSPSWNTWNISHIDYPGRVDWKSSSKRRVGVMRIEWGMPCSRLGSTRGKHVMLLPYIVRLPCLIDQRYREKEGTYARKASNFSPPPGPSHFSTSCLNWALSELKVTFSPSW